MGSSEGFGDRIRVRRVEHVATSNLLADFLERVAAEGCDTMVEWFVNRPQSRLPRRLVSRLENASLNDVEMSRRGPGIRFAKALTRSRMRELAALRCPDRYVPGIAGGQ